MDINIAQETASINQDPFLLVLLDFQKAYYILDCGCLLYTLEEYGAGPKIRGILAEF